VLPFCLSASQVVYDFTRQKQLGTNLLAIVAHGIALSIGSDFDLIINKLKV